jgi:enediyne biosynthesis protein E4
MKTGKFFKCLNPYCVGFFFYVFILGCNNSENHLFTSLSSYQTGIKFKNILKETKEFNVLTYGYLYNGGGVAVGDVNNDGLEDLYFTGNMVASRLYINQGNLKFKEVAKAAGVDAPGLWNTGTTMADVNGDGWLDIFVCRSAAANPILRRNLLFLNNGDMTFTESAAILGLNDTGYTTQALFFDYDRDNDLDLYVLNHSVQKFAGFDRLTGGLKEKNNPNYGDKLYENVGGLFFDRTQTAGIKTNVLGFGLGVAMGDFNHDQWPDLYISNDYNEQDYLYINNQDGTFSDQLERFITHSSMFSMGSDVADINNDGYTDIFTLDMLPESNARQKMVFGPDNYEKYQQLVNSGFYNQTMRNMLHLNQGGSFFTEIGQMAGVSNTDWSWASLFADFDNDGLKDLFVTNGYKRDYTNMDFVSYAVQQRINEMKEKEEIAVIDLIEQIPSTVETNYIFKNLGKAQFKKMNSTWGFKDKTLSNGAAYADLDNDGDLDLIINNIDATASILRNNTNPNKDSYLQIRLLDTLSFNREGIGATVTVYAEGSLNQQVQQPVRGYQSSVGRTLHFGLDASKKIDSIAILWPDGKKQVEKNRIPKSTLTIHKNASNSSNRKSILNKPYFKKTMIQASSPVEHQENIFVDFKRERLLPHYLSTQGPRVAVGDVNQDGLQDFYLCGAKGLAGSLWLQKSNGNFQKSKQFQRSQTFEKEEVDALFFDADNDGDDDLYVVSGGNENEGESLQDQLYLNHNGVLKASSGLPKQWKSGSCVAASDFDADGDLDLFVGTRGVPGRYPESAPNQLLINSGKGVFKLANQLLPEQNRLGNVTDALWEDVDGDKKQDLVIVGEWMPITILYQQKEGFIASKNETLQHSTGLWNRLIKGDFNKDGKMDFVAGNYGLNSQLKAPLSLYYGDFDQNGALEPILCTQEAGKEYPFWSKDDIQSQWVALKSRYVSYASYADQTIQDILTPKQLTSAKKLDAQFLGSSIIINEGKDNFSLRPLSASVQVAPVFGLLPFDVNADGNLDLITGGNLYGTRVKLGRYDASKGEVLLGDGKGEFMPITYQHSGFRVNGEVRDIVPLNVGEEWQIIFAKNNAPIEVYMSAVSKSF